MEMFYCYIVSPLPVTACERQGLPDKYVVIYMTEHGGG